MHKVVQPITKRNIKLNKNNMINTSKRFIVLKHVIAKRINGGYGDKGVIIDSILKKHADNIKVISNCKFNIIKQKHEGGKTYHMDVEIIYNKFRLWMVGSHGSVFNGVFGSRIREVKVGFQHLYRGVDLNIRPDYLSVNPDLYEKIMW